MSENSSNPHTNTPVRKPKLRIGRAILVSLWVVGAFFFVQLLISAVFIAARSVGVTFENVNMSVLSTVLSGVIYTLTLLFVVAIPWLVKRYRTTRSDLGVQRSLEWRDLLLAPPAFIIYLIMSWAVMTAAVKLVPGFDVTQVQDVLFNDLGLRYEYLLAFLTLVIVAPIAEELLFRGYLFSKLKKYLPVWLAIVFTSILFGAVHGQWNVAIDTFALSVVMCGLREYTGTIWAGVVLHMMKNGLAFYLLFVNPALMSGIAG